MLIEVESEANANAALLEAQALDVRAVSSAFFPEVLEFRFQEDILDKLEAVADRLPQIVNVGAMDGTLIDFMTIARQMLGVPEGMLYTDEDMQAIRERVDSIVARIKERSLEISAMAEEEKDVATPVRSEDILADEKTMDERSMDEITVDDNTDEVVSQRGEEA